MRFRAGSLHQRNGIRKVCQVDRAGIKAFSHWGDNHCVLCTNWQVRYLEQGAGGHDERCMNNVSWERILVGGIASGEIIQAFWAKIGRHKTKANNTHYTNLTITLLNLPFNVTLEIHVRRD